MFSAYPNGGVNVFSAGHSLCVCVFLQVRDEIERFGIKVYQFPECDSDEEEEFKQMDKELKVSTIVNLHFESSLHKDTF